MLSCSGEEINTKWVVPRLLYNMGREIYYPTNLLDKSSTRDLTTSSVGIKNDRTVFSIRRATEVAIESRR